MKDPANEYAYSIARQRIASICLALGWNSANNSALEVLQDLLFHFIRSVGCDLRAKAELCNRTQPNLCDLQRVFQDLKIDFEDLSEYMQHFDARILITDPVPDIPAVGSKQSELNFLKPGSREVVHRPLHVDEYFPPMFPDLENEPDDAALNGGELGASPATATTSLPTDASVLPAHSGSATECAQAASVKVEADMTPLREIASVMMTSSGLISPARVGRLPESRTPAMSAASAYASASSHFSRDDYDSLTAERTGPTARSAMSLTDDHSARAGTQSSRKITMDSDSDMSGDDMSYKEFERIEKAPVKKLAVFQKKQAKPEKAVRGKAASASVPALDQKQKKKKSHNTHMDDVINSVIERGIAESHSIEQEELRKKESSSFVANTPKVKPGSSLASSAASTATASCIVATSSTPTLTTSTTANTAEQPVTALSTTSQASISSTSSAMTATPTSSMTSITKPLKRRRKKLEPSTPAMIEDSSDSSPERPAVGNKSPPRQKIKLDSLAADPVVSKPVDPDLLPNNPLIPRQVFYGFGFDSVPAAPPQPTEVRAPGLVKEALPEVDSFPLKKKFSSIDDVEKKKHDKKSKEKKSKAKKKEKEKDREKEKDKDKEKEKDKDKDKDKKEKKDKEKKKKKEKNRPVSPELFAPIKPTPVLPKIKLKDLTTKPEEEKSPKLVFKGVSPMPPPAEPLLPKASASSSSSSSSSFVPELFKDSMKIERASSSTSSGASVPILADVVGGKSTKKPTSCLDSVGSAKSAKAKKNRNSGEPKSSAKKSSKAMSKNRDSDEDDSSSASADVGGFIMTQTVGHYVDSEGNQIWICPSCSRQDDGSPMIGCDRCEDWYHFICVGITQPPDENSDWYCPRCYNSMDKKASGKKGRPGRK